MANVFYTTFESGKTLVQIKLTSVESNSTANTNVRIHIVLDNSGSMAGSPFINAQEGIHKLLNFLDEEKFPCQHTRLYLFNDRVTNIPVNSYQSAISALSRSFATSTTSFAKITDSISKELLSSNNCSHSIIFFTDGRDTSNQNINEIKKIFQKNILDSDCQVQIHTIGLGDHDSHFLNDLVGMGNIPGTYQYCSSSKQIKDSMESVIGVLSIRTKKMILCIKTMDKTYGPGEIHFDVISTDGHTGYLIISNRELDPALISKSSMTLDVGLDKIISIIPKEIEQNSQNIEFYVGYIRDQIMKLVQHTKTASNEIVQKNIKEVMNLESELEMIRKSFGKLPFLTRKSVMEAYLICKNLIGEVLTIWRSGVKLNDQTLATLANKAYSHDLKKGMERRLNMRVLENENLEIEISNNVQNIVSKMDWEKLESQLKDGDNDYQCVISCNNVLDAMKISDVMCLTFNMSRSDATVISPFNMRINNICVSKITFASFCESLVFKLDKDKGGHGGFDPTIKSTILVGEARDEINAILPMYICPEHWSMAREYMKLAFGWMCTLDILGYDFLQLVSIPFALLSFVRSNSDSTFNRVYASNVLDVCKQLCISHPDYFNNVILKANQYLDVPMIRTIDQIPNNSIFLEQINVLSEIPEFSDKILIDVKCEKFIFAILEEELRRYHKNFFSNGKSNSAEPIKFFTDEQLVKILDIDRTKLIDEPISLYDKKSTENYLSNRKDLSGYYQKGCTLLGINPGDKNDQIETEMPSQPMPSIYKSNQTIIEIDGSVESKPEISKELYKIMTAYYHPLKKIWGIFSHVCADGNESQTPFESMTLTQMTAIALQNLEHCDNSSRRSAFEDKTYIDMSILENCFCYIKNLRIKTIESMKKNGFMKIDNKFAQICGNNIADAFCQAPDIPTAIGALHGVYQRKIEFEQIYTQLYSTPAPLFQHKFNMLLTGQYKGIKLVMDAINPYDMPYRCWYPRYGIIMKFMNRYPNIKPFAMTDEWVENLLPESYFENCLCNSI